MQTSKLAKSNDTDRPSCLAILIASVICSMFCCAYLTTSHCIELNSNDVSKKNSNEDSNFTKRYVMMFPVGRIVTRQMCTKGEKRKHLGAFEVILSKLVGLLDGHLISQIIRLLRDVKCNTAANKGIPAS